MGMNDWNIAECEIFGNLGNYKRSTITLIINSSYKDDSFGIIFIAFMSKLFLRKITIVILCYY